MIATKTIENYNLYVHMYEKSHLALDVYLCINVLTNWNGLIQLAFYTRRILYMYRIMIIEIECKSFPIFLYSQIHEKTEVFNH